MLWDFVLWDFVLWDFVRRDFVRRDFVLWDSVPDSFGSADNKGVCDKKHETAQLTHCTHVHHGSPNIMVAVQ